MEIFLLFHKNFHYFLIISPSHHLNMLCSMLLQSSLTTFFYLLLFIRTFIQKLNKKEAEEKGNFDCLNIALDWNKQKSTKIEKLNKCHYIIIMVAYVRISNNYNNRLCPDLSSYESNNGHGFVCSGDR